MADLFNIDLVRGIVLLTLIFAFLGIWAWAWSRKRHATFEEASMLPLEEDDGTIPDSKEKDSC